MPSPQNELRRFSGASTRAAAEAFVSNCAAAVIPAAFHSMRLGLIANVEKNGARELVSALRKEFGRHPVQIAFEARTAALIGLKSKAKPHELARDADLLLVLGGDGTILEVLHDLDDRLPPIFGINIGTLGFLTCAGASAYLETVESIVNGRYHLSERTLLDIEVYRADELTFKGHALNDAVISRGEQSRLIRLDVRIDGDALTDYNADGLIIATPTGSTAYSLSAGGPVLAPDSGVFVVTPICPHVLSNRSVIVADQARIEIAPLPGQGAVFMMLDGRASVRVEPEDTIGITKAAHRLSIAMPPGMSFFEVLRQKLKWSGGVV
jgi:NAD+ kinase